MFSWICPQCGRDVPPSKTDCPFCADQAKEAAAYAAAGPPPMQVAPESQSPWQQPPAGYGAPIPVAPTWPPPPQQAPQQPPQYAPPPQQYSTQQYAPQAAAPSAPPQQQYAPPPPPPQQYAPLPQQYAPPRPQAPPQAAWPQATTPTRSTPPTWLVAVGFAAALLLLGGGIYYFFLRAPSGPTAEKAGLENPSNASQQKVSNPLQKYVEVVGVRMITEDKKPIAKFVVVNHSATEIDGLSANVTLWASTSRSEEDSVGSFSFKLPEIGANDSVDLKAPLKTKKLMYELPDWQNTTAEIQITSPAP
jgi:hypothetical protein